MKKLNFILFIFSLLVSSTFAEEAVQEDAVIGLQHDADNDRLQQLMAIPEVQKIHEVCKASSPSSVEDCLWNEIQQPNNKKVKEMVDQALAQTKGQSRVDTKGKFESLELVEIEKEKDPALEEMQKYFQKKLESTLFDFKGGATGKQHNFVDHKVFNDLFRSQVGKNIILAMTSYCIDADSEFVIFEDETKRKSTKNSNLGNLKTVTAKGKSVAYDSWGDCIKYIDPVCHKKTLMKKDNQGQKTVDKDFSQDWANSKSYKTEDFEYSRRRACEVVQYMKSARQNLKTLDKIDEFYADQNKKGSGPQISANVKHFDATKKGNSVDDLTTVSSNEVKEDLKFNESKQKELAALEECISQDTTGAYIINKSTACEKYLAQDHTEINKLKAEVKLRAESLNEKVIAMKNSKDPELVKEYLIDQGYSDDEITAKFDLSNDISVQKIADEITSNMEEEKARLIESLSKKLDAKKTKNEGKLNLQDGALAGGQGEDAEKLMQIHKELSSDTENYTKLIHFTNIVSSYLDVEGDGGKQSKNTSSFYAEMENSAFDPSQNEELGAGNGYTADQRTFTEIESTTGIEEQRVPSSKGGDVKTVGKDEIDKLLKYNSEN